MVDGHRYIPNKYVGSLMELCKAGAKIPPIQTPHSDGHKRDITRKKKLLEKQKEGQKNTRK